MKAILVFSLPEDNCAHRIAVKAMDWAMAMSALDARLRDWIKYGGYSFKGDDAALLAVRDELHKIMDDHGVSLNDIE